ncbi:MAG: hypothetical protein ATN34_04845 [Epulopiscium sp. Nele67-Bin002]|nr:MAG: hypothetical protein BEN18_07420 [Epulopiscium sp. Nuni2H_MBin001]OON92265.1 MAG: hypothetical protein ATN34_04845 [Epulopiscium sp. Nele67-Bin002]
MTFIEEIIEATNDIWEQYLEQPFPTGVVQGTIDKELFKNYIVEDSIYLNEYARVFGAGMLNSRRKSDIMFFYQALNFLEESEGSTRLYYLKQFGLTDEWIESQQARPTNVAYTEYMLSVAREGTPLEILMAVLPCILSYGYTFRELVAKYGLDESNPYAKLVNDYIGDGYFQYCYLCGKFANKLAGEINMTDEYKQKLIEIFRQGSLYEVKFWDMANTR